mmetsp:Transcript_28048/g.41734  ORF Transcript_28048/g.41734 Transcript_28048/m.41734 type:complete len:234 (+) Transcript_28048:117-818(+)
MVKVSPSSPSWSSIEIASCDTPFGMASSSKTTLWGPLLLLTQVTESPLQIVVFSRTNLRPPLSSPILTTFVSAPNAGWLTAATLKPAARPAARAIALRRVQILSDTTMVSMLLPNSFQSIAIASGVLRFSLKEDITGSVEIDKLGLLTVRARQVCPVGHFVPGSNGNSCRSPPVTTTSRSRCSDSTTASSLEEETLRRYIGTLSAATLLPSRPISTRVLKIMIFSGFSVNNNK